MKVEVVYGEENTRKVRDVYERYGSHNVYTIYSLYPTRDTWFNGYNGENVVLVENFFGQIPASCLMQLMDDTRRPYQVLCIASPVHPGKWYKNITATRAVVRRIDVLQFYRRSDPTLLRRYLSMWKRGGGKHLRIPERVNNNNGEHSGDVIRT